QQALPLRCVAVDEGGAHVARGAVVDVLDLAGLEAELGGKAGLMHHALHGLEHGLALAVERLAAERAAAANLQDSEPRGEPLTAIREHRRRKCLGLARKELTV